MGMSTLKDLRLDTGKTQEEIAEQTGYSREYINALENGRRTMSRGAAETLAPVYGTTAGELMGYVNAENRAILKEERDVHKAEMDELIRIHAEEIHAKQKEIDLLQAQVEQLNQSLTFAKSMCEILKKQLDILQRGPSNRENS